MGKTTRRKRAPRTSAAPSVFVPAPTGWWVCLAVAQEDADTKLEFRRVVAWRDGEPITATRRGELEDLPATACAVFHEQDVAPAEWNRIIANHNLVSYSHAEFKKLADELIYG